MCDVFFVVFSCKICHPLCYSVHGVYFGISRISKSNNEHRAQWVCGQNDIFALHFEHITSETIEFKLIFGCTVKYRAKRERDYPYKPWFCIQKTFAKENSFVHISKWKLFDSRKLVGTFICANFCMAAKLYKANSNFLLFILVPSLSLCTVRMLHFTGIYFILPANRWISLFKLIITPQESNNAENSVGKSNAMKLNENRHKQMLFVSAEGETWLH